MYFVELSNQHQLLQVSYGAKTISYLISMSKFLVACLKYVSYTIQCNIVMSYYCRLGQAYCPDYDE